MNQSAGAAQNVRRYSADPKDLDVGPDRNWKGIGISLLVILLVLSLIGLSIVLLSKDDSSKSTGSVLTLDDLFQKRFQVHDPEASWISDEEYIFRRWDGDVVKGTTQSNHTHVLLKNSTFITFKASWFSVSPDLNFVLLAYDVKQVYKHSFLASYLIYNLHTREVTELNPPEVSDSVLQFASWGVQGQQLIYIFENNIYYQTDVSSSSWRLTSSGQEGVLFNGITDWLYEEEVLHSQVSHWWSPDGSRLAYLSINDSLVPSMHLVRFTGALYPRGHSYPYPKMGQVNPVVRLFVVSLDGSSVTTELRPPDSFDHSSEYYITMVTWATNQKAAVRWVNRGQNTSVLTLCDVTRGQGSKVICVKKHVMESEAWLDRQNEEPVFSKDGSTFFITTPLKHGGTGAFRHIAMISDQSKGQEVNVGHLTSGSWEVCEILAYDDVTQRLYFLSTEDGPTQRQLYSVSTVHPFHRQCVSCLLFTPQCLYYSALFSPDQQHVLLSCRGPGIPQTTLHRLTDMTDSVMVDNNQVLREALGSTPTPEKHRRTVLINDLALRLEISVPKHLDQNKQHPLLLMIDSSPGGQSVNDRFSLDWDSVLVSSDHVIVARLDARGSGFQGQQILHGVHHRLGSVDLQDHVAALEYLLRLPYVDQTRVGVYGKVYGGFLSALLLLSHGSMVKCGVTVTPVTDWRLYGSAFTERYFGFPGQKDHRYQISSLLSNISASIRQKLLIVHGTADASVHFQHSAELVKLLTSSNYTNYTLQMFPDEDQHLSSERRTPWAGSRGSQSQLYMLSSVVHFFRSCFQEEPLVVPVQSLAQEDEDD